MSLPIVTRSKSAPTALAPSVPPSSAFELHESLGALYALSQRSQYVFGSPLGPFFRQARHAHLPRFVYFGPHTSDESLRLAFYAGFDSSDLRGTLALLHFVERLALAPDLGQGLNLSFFPLVNMAGLSSANSASLAAASWQAAPAPELELLAQDVRLRGYHGFVRVETTPHEDDVVTIRLRGDAAEALGVEIISSEDVEPWSVRWEADDIDAPVVDGPLSLADDLPFQPFELTLSLPAAWSAELHREAVTAILKRFILRYRGFQAYGQHL